MDWFQRAPTKVVVGAAALAVGCAGVVLLSRKLKEYEKIHPDAPGKYQTCTEPVKDRPMDMEEIWFCHTQNGGNLHTMTDLVIGGKEVTEDILRKALIALEERHPYLRMQIVNRGSNPIDLWLEELPASARGQVLTVESGVDPEQQFEDMINRVLFKWPAQGEVQTEPIRTYYVTLVKRKPGDTESHLIWCFHHAMVDGGSRFAIFQDFFKYLEILSTGKEPKVESLEMLRPVGDILDTVLPPPPEWTIPFYSFLNCIPFLWRWVCSHPLAESPGTLDPETYLPKRKSKLIRMLFTEEESTAIRNASKKHGTTMHGTISAALAHSLHNILLKHNKFTGHRAITQHLASLRHLAAPRVPAENVGRVFSRFYLYTDLDKEGGTFWDTAVEMKQQLIDEMKRNRKTALPFQMFGNIHAKLREHVRDALTRTGFSYSISNLGNQQFKDSYGPYTLQQCWSAVAEHIYGHLFAHNIVSVKGRLNFSFSWYDHVMYEEEAQEYADAFKAMLLFECGCPSPNYRKHFG
mmetsp:Transcript_19605/g.23504  ORF Transcript_19605/g.23504 Transcript_19605/m.23504 type:complete len:521 (-) Transcript_19605:148-1710(-)